MDNRKRNVHTSGPLGMLVKNGQVKKIEEPELFNSEGSQVQAPKSTNLYFKTQSGVEFSENELVYVDPKECEPWKYANRQQDELGDIEELIASIKNNKQLQPALIRNHPAPHDNVKYEIIFGRRRHLACLKLNVPLLVIRKNITDIQDAIVLQDAENKLRNDVSNYSNAKLYQKLLLEGVFKTEKELSTKLRISSSTLNDLMAYAKIPDDIVEGIHNIHLLSKNMALKIIQLLNKSENNHHKLRSLSKQIGKTITSPTKLENAVEKSEDKNKNGSGTQLYTSQTGKKLFTFSVNHRGLPSMIINKEILSLVEASDICKILHDYLEKKIQKSGAPDLSDSKSMA